MILPSRAASPTPELTTTFTRPGTWCTFEYPNSFWRFGTISERYFCLRRGWMVPASATVVSLMAYRSFPDFFA